MARFQRNLPRQDRPGSERAVRLPVRHEVPRITKITLNMGVSGSGCRQEGHGSRRYDLTKIAGQKPVVTKARKAIAGFKIREQQPIGCMVTCVVPRCTNSGPFRHRGPAARA